jgi:hypothetical protein
MAPQRGREGAIDKNIKTKKEPQMAKIIVTNRSRAQQVKVNFR